MGLCYGIVEMFVDEQLLFLQYCSFLAVPSDVSLSLVFNLLFECVT